jgi:hypothetical protein
MIAVPLVFTVFAGRQTDLSTDSGTAQERIRLWSGGFQLLREHPVFGIGMNQHHELLGLAAHNSYIHAFTELGLLGGGLFLGANLAALYSLVKVGRAQGLTGDPSAARLGPYLVGIVALYQAGMLSSTRCYALPTYLILGLAEAYAQFHSAQLREPLLKVNWKTLTRLLAISSAVIAIFYLYIRMSARFE